MYFIPPDMDPNFFVDKGFTFFTMPWARWALEGIKNGLSGIKRTDDALPNAQDGKGTGANLVIPLSGFSAWVTAVTLRPTPSQAGRWFPS